MTYLWYHALKTDPQCGPVPAGFVTEVMWSCCLVPQPVQLTPKYTCIKTITNPGKSTVKHQFIVKKFLISTVLKTVLLEYGRKVKNNL